MRKLKPSPVVSKAAALLFTWGSLALVLVAGGLLLYVYQDDVLPYVGYFAAAVAGTGVLFTLLTWAILREKTIKTAGRVPIVIWTCIVLAAGVAGTIVGGPKIAAEHFSTGPFIQWTGDQDPSDAITVSWITSSSEPTLLWYGSSPTDLYSSWSSSEPTRYHHVPLDGFYPGTTYYYQVPGFPVKQFTTAPAGASNYTFYAWADHRTNTDIIASFMQPNVVSHIASYAATHDAPGAFSICAGDVTSQANDFLSWDTFYDDIAYQDWTANRSMQMAFGNHERYGETDAATVRNHFPYQQRADGHFFYSFDYGAAHFIILDPYAGGHSWTSNFSAAQLAWLEGDLAANTDANFTLVFMHPPPWTLSGVKAELARLANVEGYDIDVVFCGHDHIFDRRNLATTTIQVLTLGLGGNPNNEY
ncbi:MAG: metallophosphoesterase family protein, partial [Candidatus Lokiarchaeota archaeon]|nr:metallophosphoesterase family protein [Candidatus Lokiarchaeota archaeon]